MLIEIIKVIRNKVGIYRIYYLLESINCILMWIRVFSEGLFVGRLMFKKDRVVFRRIVEVRLIVMIINNGFRILGRICMNIMWIGCWFVMIVVCMYFFCI